MTIVNIKSQISADKFKHKIGNYYRNLQTGEIYLLAAVTPPGNRATEFVSLFCLNDGCYWSDGCEVDDQNNILPGEFRDIKDEGAFEHIKSISITVD